jgi:hypothetical protein
VGFFMLTADGRELATMTKQLGMHVPLRSVSKSGKALYLDLGSSWDAMSEPDRQQEMAAIAEGAGKLGFTDVYLYAGGTRVAESHGSKVCADESCFQQPTTTRTQ